MVNINYNRGRAKEYRIAHKFKKMGYDIAQRTAGSHSPFDVIAISKADKRIYLVQSKPDGYKSKEYDQYDWLNDNFEVKFILM